MSGVVRAALATVVVGAGMVAAGAPAATAADGCPNAAVRAQQQAEYLPDCRAYELVSPADKNGYPIFDFPATAVGATASAPDGERAIYSSWGIFAGGTSGMPAQYRAHRTPEGWSSEVVSAPPASPNPDLPASNGGTLWKAFTPDLRFGAIETNEPLDAADVNGVSDVYVTDGGRPRLVTQGGHGEQQTVNDVDMVHGLSDDGSHIVFRSLGHLTVEDAPREAGLADVYERVGDRTQLVNVDDGGHLLNRCGSMVPGDSTAGRISADGSRVVFISPRGAGVAPDCPQTQHLYVRVDGERTVQADRSRVAGPQQDQSASFIGAARDGSVLYFTTGKLLTADASGAAAYRYEPGTDRLEVAVPGEARVVKVSPDGSHLYFVSAKDLVPGGGTPGNWRLYAYHDERIDFVADSGVAQADADGAARFGGNGADQMDIEYESARLAAVSTDGRRLVFMSTRDLTGQNPGGNEKLYRYDERDGSVVCVSCGLPGPPRGGVSLTLRVNADASVVAFTTSERLVARDVNSTDDVYRWKDGDLSLVSSGRGTVAERLTGISDDGASIFFSSYTSLAPQDVDDGDQDLYVARVDGGFATGADGVSQPCSGDGCQPSGTAPPAFVAAASATLQGAGDPPPARPVGRKPRVSAAKVVRGTSTVVRVAVPSRGRVTIAGSSVRRVSRSAPRPATYRVRVALTVSGVRALRRHGSLRRTLRVTFRPSSGASSAVALSVTFRVPAVTKRGRS